MEIQSFNNWASRPGTDMFDEINKFYKKEEEFAKQQGREFIVHFTNTSIAASNDEVFIIVTIHFSCQRKIKKVGA